MRQMINAAWRALRVRWLQWCLDSNQQYADACSRDGIMDTASLQEWARQRDALRVSIAQLGGTGARRRPDPQMDVDEWMSYAIVPVIELVVFTIGAFCLGVGCGWLWFGGA